MIRGDKHKRKITLVHRGRTRAYGTKRVEGDSKGVADFKLFITILFTISEKRIHCGVTVTKQVLINTTKNQLM
jgi:hypothetical protein